MPGTTRPITYNDKVAGVVISVAGTDGRLTTHRFVDVDVNAAATTLVHGMALYAMQIHEGELPGPYDDDAALAYAHAAIELAHGTADELLPT